MKVAVFDNLSPRRSQFQIPSSYAIDFDGNLDYIEIDESNVDFLVPNFEIASNPEISLASIRARRFRIVEENSTEGVRAEYMIDLIGFVS
jgi:hypothetical protein